jgi:hypothetical protein
MYLQGKEYKTHQMSDDAVCTSLKGTANGLVYHMTIQMKREEFHSEIIKKADKNHIFRKNCLDHEYCVIGFFELNDSDKFRENMEKLENLQKDGRFSKARFVWIDAVCHDYLAKYFDVNLDKLPDFTFYYRWRGTYSTFSSIWDAFPMTFFMEKALENRLDEKEIARDLPYMKSISCNQGDEDTVDEETKQQGDIPSQEENTTIKIDL